MLIHIFLLNKKCTRRVTRNVLVLSNIYPKAKRNRVLLMHPCLQILTLMGQWGRGCLFF